MVKILIVCVLAFTKMNVDEDTGCILPGRDWIQCGEDDCGVWSHINILEECYGGFMCAVVNVISYELLFFRCSFASFKLDNNIFNFL